MDWAINGVRLLGLALFAAWEYIVFKQRYASRRSELRARQIEGAAAVMRALSALYLAVQRSQLAQSPPASEQQIQSLYAEAVALQTHWVAFLPSKLNAAIADFLKLLGAGARSRGVADPMFQQQARRAYIELVACARQTLGIEPLSPEALAVLEQPSEASGA